MGRPSAAAPSSSYISSQHERLILELLPFATSAQFHEWLSGPYVRGSWQEFCRDFLSANPSAPEPDKAKTAQAARDAVKGKSPKYLAYHPEKQGWSAEDHHVRFIATVVADNMLTRLWSEDEFRKRGVDVAKAVYEVLSFLRGAALVNPPSYEA
ncbi:hypothetical protein NKR23_g9860 [Pleurostoma richardsiae]|uniref:Uncharacterized protein n=1 Tax=Pleurostoma richardsiae TaxID=41990 RepID=A0AA38RP71_9PEZI|nr:hypothetical protein NKR23_g9860 [Pleurostoma richardsiae]